MNFLHLGVGGGGYADQNGYFRFTTKYNQRTNFTHFLQCSLNWLKFYLKLSKIRKFSKKEKLSLYCEIHIPLFCFIMYPNRIAAEANFSHSAQKLIFALFVKETLYLNKATISAQKYWWKFVLALISLCLSLHFTGMPVMRGKILKSHI